MIDKAAQRRRVAMYNNNALKIGLFGANCSSGRSVTRAKERWSGSWADCLKLAKMADEAGIDFLLPIARWKGRGGASDYQGATLETINWASGLLASTKRITVFGTVHAPLVPPVLAAKSMATADHIGEGRFGLNVVCGWNEDEFDMFGVTLHNHETRYEYAQEWLDFVRQLWGDEDGFDFNGKFIKSRNASAAPNPYGNTQPMIMNAGASETGKAFAIRNCDALFMGGNRNSPAETQASVLNVKNLAKEQGHDVGVFTVGIVTCRRTKKEAEEFQHYSVVENADWDAVDRMLANKKITRESHSPEEFEKARLRMANGAGGLIMVGDPDDIARDLAGLAQVGLNGIALSMVNYLNDLPLLRDEVLPRLERLGVREPARALA